MIQCLTNAVQFTFSLSWQQSILRKDEEKTKGTVQYNFGQTSPPEVILYVVILAVLHTIPLKSFEYPPSQEKKTHFWPIPCQNKTIYLFLCFVYYNSYQQSQNMDSALIIGNRRWTYDVEKTQLLCKMLMKENLTEE